MIKTICAASVLEESDPGAGSGLFYTLIGRRSPPPSQNAERAAMREKQNFSLRENNEQKTMRRLGGLLLLLPQRGSGCVRGAPAFPFTPDDVAPATCRLKSKKRFGMCMCFPARTGWGWVGI